MYKVPSGLIINLSNIYRYFKPVKKLQAYLADFIALLFPQLCYACGNSLISSEDLICTDCLYNLPYTNFYHQPDNIVARQFWGKVKLEAAWSLLYFTKGGKVQQLIHHLKYKNTPQIGNKLGHIAAERLLRSPGLTRFDGIIPVPLHNSRLRKRGYNQSACFAEGLAQGLDTRAIINNLIRTKATETQTRKSRFERSANMREVFAVADAKGLTNKHILLVDDVVTTGSTLEACAQALLAVPGLRLSIATIAYAE
jgi:ComF family protein